MNYSGKNALLPIVCYTSFVKEIRVLKTMIRIKIKSIVF